MMRAIAGRRKALILALGLMAPALAGAADEPRLADYFGFLPLEVYKLDTRIGNLLIRDLDGDKVDDIAVANNARSRIDLLLSGKKPGDGGGGDNPAAEKKDRDVNQVGNDRRMRLVSIPVNKAVISLQAGDFDGDGRVDLVYFGEPAGIEILPNRGDGRFGEPKRINVGEAVEAPGALSVGDFDKDGRDDLALLTSGEDEMILILPEARAARWASPSGCRTRRANPRMVKLGRPRRRRRGRPGHPRTAATRTRSASASPGAREAATLRARAAVRHRAPAGLRLRQRSTASPGSELLTIEAQSGRVRVHVARRRPRTTTPPSAPQLLFYPLPQGNDAQGRSLDLGDLDGDGLIPTSSPPTRPMPEFFVHPPIRKGTGLGASQSLTRTSSAARPVKLWPTSTATSKAEVYVLSEQGEADRHRSVLRRRSVNSFPVALAHWGASRSRSTVADLDGDGKPEVVYVTRDKAERLHGRASTPCGRCAVEKARASSSRSKAGASVDSRCHCSASMTPPTDRQMARRRPRRPARLPGVSTSSGPQGTCCIGRPGNEPPAPASGGGLGPLDGHLTRPG